MSLPLSGKDKASRVPLDYYRETGARRRRWGWLVFLALLALAGGAWGFGYWKQASSPGPIHSAHAAWENDCSVCHTAFSPTSSANGLAAFSKDHGRASDDNCKKCHMGLEEQGHHKNQIDEQVGSCASCHTDHRGRSFFMTRVADAKCTSCHADLGGHTKGGKTSYHNKVTRFDRDHPQFSVGSGDARAELGKAKDPGRLKFNHLLHLEKGQTVGWTFAQIKDQKLRARYMEMHRKLFPNEKDITPETEVGLNCASCHQLDATDEPGRAGPARAAGDYFLPVTFEQHCRACHPLTFSGEKALKDVEMPHLLQPDAVTSFLWGFYVQKVTDPVQRQQLLDTTRPLPGTNQPGQGARARKDLEGQVLKSQSFVFRGKAGCGLCHTYDLGAAGVPKVIEPVNVPEVWFPHAKFSHHSHRAVDCLQCHDGAKKSEKKDDVLIPGVENCVKCHATARTEKGVKLGGERQDCVTCHRYHHGDAPLSGRGAAARGVDLRRGIEDWLKGK